MPWTLQDVDSHIKGLSDKRKRAWVGIANGVLAECMKAGGTDETCAPKAIRIANSRAKGMNHQEVSRMTKDANLSEVGKTISAATAAKLTAALQALENAVGVVSDLLMPEVADTGEAARDPQTVLAEAQKIITKGKSLDAIRTQVSAAIQDKFGKPSYPGPPYVTGIYTWCRDVFTDSAVYELDGKLYRVAYTIDATSGESKVILGDPVEVEVAYVTAGEAAVEAAKDPNVGGGVDRTKIPAEDCAGKNKSFPIVIPKDVADAASSIGRAGKDNYSTDELKANIIKIAKRKGEKFMAMLPDAWQSKPKESAAPTSDVAGEINLVECAMLDSFSLREITLSESARKSTVPIKLIGPGWGASGYYSERVLKEEGPKAWPAGTHMYWNHPTDTEMRERPEGDIDRLAAVLVTDPVWREDGLKGRGLYAESKLFSDYADQVSEKGPYIGVSVRAKGEYVMGEAEGKKGKIIEHFAQGNPLQTGHTTDFVTRAGAGGAVITESSRTGVVNLSEAAQGRESNKGVSTMTEVEVTALQSALAEKEAKLAAYEKAAVIREATEIVTSVFAEVKVNPPPKLVAKLTATVPMKEGKVDTDAFRAEVKEIAETMKPVVESGEVRGMGSGGGLSSTDATSVADHAALVESFERRFRNQGKKPDEAKKLAESAAGGR